MWYRHFGVPALHPTFAPPIFRFLCRLPLPAFSQMSFFAAQRAAPDRLAWQAFIDSPSTATFATALPHPIPAALSAAALAALWPLLAGDPATWFPLLLDESCRPHGQALFDQLLGKRPLPPPPSPRMTCPPPVENLKTCSWEFFAALHALDLNALPSGDAWRIAVFKAMSGLEAGLSAQQIAIVTESPLFTALDEANRRHESG